MSKEKNNTGYWNTGNRNTGNWNTGDRNTGYWNTGNRNTGYWNTGNRNTGHSNTGYWNTGNRNTGHSNTGHWNTGHWNTGHRNTGNWNTGDRNTGYWNTGNWNTGHRNTGHRNTGYLNTGNWNTGNRNTGYLNTINQKVVIFNKQTELKHEEIQFPNFFYYILTEWIEEEEMTDKEKESYPTYVTTGGYLKSYTDKQAWRNSWDKADMEDRKKVLALPNWDNEIFKEISGIDVEKELNNNVEEMTMGEVCKALGKTIKIKK